MTAVVDPSSREDVGARPRVSGGERTEPDHAAPGPRAIDPREPEVRLAALLDEGTLVGLHATDTSGVWAVRGRIDGSKVIAYCTDGTRMGGAMGHEGCRHIVDAIETAVRERIPVIGLWHSGGARLAEGVQALDGVGQVFAAMVRASGRVPQISVVLGAAAGGAAYGPALTDIVIMAPDGRVFVTGPDVVKSVTGEQVDMEALGGPSAHGRKSGVVHIVADSEADALRAGPPGRVAVLPSGYLRGRRHAGRPRPGPAAARAAGRARTTSSRSSTPSSTSRWKSCRPKWAPNIVIGLGRLGGRSVGVVANNPLRLGGCLDSTSAEKASRFVRMCDAFGIPLLVIVDVPGYLPGVGQEWDGVVRRGAKLLHAFAEAVVPRVTLVTRKAYGGAYVAMNSKSLGATAVFAWPDAEIAVMGAKAAVGILHRRKLAAAPDDEREALHAALALEHDKVAGGVAQGHRTRRRRRGHHPGRRPGGGWPRPWPPRRPAAAAHGNIPL